MGSDLVNGSCEETEALENRLPELTLRQEARERRKISQCETLN
jgi:hypothetical protein